MANLITDHASVPDFRIPESLTQEEGESHLASQRPLSVLICKKFAGSALDELNVFFVPAITSSDMATYALNDLQLTLL